MMDYRILFTSQEWDLLRAAPFNVQVLVSQADDVRELDEIGPLLDILMSYEGDSLIQEIFKDTLEATEEDRLIKDHRVALDEVSAAIALIQKNTSDGPLADNTAELFCKELLSIAEQTATADIEGLEQEEESIINLLKSKFV